MTRKRKSGGAPSGDDAPRVEEPMDPKCDQLPPLGDPRKLASQELEGTSEAVGDDALETSTPPARRRGPNKQSPITPLVAPAAVSPDGHPTLFPMVPQWSRQLYKSGQSTICNIPPPVCQMLNYRPGDLMIITPLPIGAMIFIPPDVMALTRHLILNPLLQICHEVPAEKLASVRLAFSVD